MKDLKHKTGEIPPHRIPIIDHKGNVRGHVGRTATGATVARFLGRHGAKLGTKDGREAWIGDRPPPPPKPTFPGMDDAGKPGAGKPGADRPPDSKHSLEILFKAAQAAKAGQR